MKTAKIGTIMPWAGNSISGTLIDNVPEGWILCDGRVYQADRYPILASVLGNSYGGTQISGTFPHYIGTIKVPDITGRALIDLEPFMITQAAYNAGQSDAYIKLVDGEGESMSTSRFAGQDNMKNISKVEIFRILAPAAKSKI